MNPTPRSAGASSIPSSARGRTGSSIATLEGTRKASDTASLTAPPSAIPRKIQVLAPAAGPLVARSTSAQARPSGYGSSASASTMSRRRSGIIAARPSTPPARHKPTTCRYGGAMPHRKSAGMVKIVPLASEVDADPIVWDRLASRIVERSPSARKTATVITAAGIDADTVSPTRSPR